MKTRFHYSSHLEKVAEIIWLVLHGHLNHLIFSFSSKTDVMRKINPSQVETNILELKGGFYQFKQIN